MITSYKNTIELLEDVTAKKLYANLILQLNKDFNYAAVDVSFPKTIEPAQLITELHEIIYRLIQEKFAEYLNLLYIVDVPEKDVKNLEEADTIEISRQVLFMILKREWQKVWFKSVYSTSN
ncbi:hypothetical protein [Spongiivirga citrea]|uniref:Uncharacterized protein n=1 Tax=Spongiivirga citrea TaxID=1481457 RepID=A0A6M0CK99_9FLAO|nr:hypothetical protein [Spongiivirga citrea]NER18042.1 hypothetical protein [Spongiivirga citrea]